MTPDLLASPRWTAAIPWFFSSRARPWIGDEDVVTRCGRCVVAVDRRTGQRRRESELDPPAAGETFFLRSGAGWLTDVHRHPPGLATVLSLAEDGSTRWRADLPTIASARGGILLGETLVLPAKQPKGGQRLFVFSAPSTSGAFTNVALARGVSRIVAASARIVVANSMAGDQGNGLYSIGLDGADSVELAAAPTVDLAGGPERVVAVLREPSGLEAVAFDVSTATRAWSVPVSDAAVATSSGLVVMVENHQPVCRRLDCGELVWRAASSAVAITSAAIAGGLVFLGHDRGREVLALDDGATLGAITSGYGPVAVDGDALYVAGRQSVTCAPHPRGAP